MLTIQKKCTIAALLSLLFITLCSHAVEKGILYYNDFESKDDSWHWVLSKDKPCKVNFKGLTTEEFFAGKKSFKLDVTFSKPGRYIWAFSIPEFSLKGTILSAYIKLGKESNTLVALGPSVKLVIPPASHTAYSGCTEPGPHRRSTNGKWQNIVLGNTIATDLDIFGRQMIDVKLQGIDTRYIKPEEVTACTDKIIINISVKKPGERLVLYLDELYLKNKNPFDVKSKMAADNNKAEPRFKKKIQNINKQLAIASQSIAQTKWTSSTLWIKRSLNKKIAKVSKELVGVRKKNLPFGVIDTELATITATIQSLDKLRKEVNSNQIVYIIKNPTSTNNWILPSAKLIPGIVDNKLSVAACGGEYEATSFVVKAMKMKTLNSLLVKPEALKNDNGDTIPAKNIDIKLVKCWYQGASAGFLVHTRKGGPKLVPELLLNDDSLVKVDYKKKQNFLKLTFADKVKYRNISNSKPKNKSKDIIKNPVLDSPKLLPVNVPAGNNQQFWITIKVPQKTPAGNYEGKLKLTAAGKLIDTLTLKLKVLPFKLVKPYYTASVDYHGTPAKNGSISSWAKNDEQMLAEFENLLAHGMTNCQHYFKVNPQSLKKVMELRSKAGMSNDILYLKGHRLPLILKKNQEEQLKMITKKTRAIVDMAKKYGAKEVYFYGIDEVVGSKLFAQKKIWKAIRDGGAKIFVAGGRDNLQMMGDIQNMMVKDGWPDKKEVEGWHKYKHKIFCYYNPQSGIEDPVPYRRNYGLLMWKYNYDGIADNAYQHTFGFTWNDFDHKTFRDHTFAYPTKNGVVDTIGWEAYREAVDDVRYINTLEKMIDKAEKYNRNKKSLKRQISIAKMFVKNLKSGYSIENTNSDKIRKKIIEQILSLQKMMS